MQIQTVQATQHLLFKAVPALLVLCVFSLLAAAKNAPASTIIITNKAGFTRSGEVIRIPGNALGKQAAGYVPQVMKNGQPLITQTIDTSGDGSWDVLLTAVTLAPYGSDTLQVYWVKNVARKKPAAVTNVWMSLRTDNGTPSPEMNTDKRSRGFTQNIAKPYYQMEGPGIENDKVAFRAFFDARNGKDIYGKIVDTPVLKYVGAGASWHQMQWWGKDILKVGGSLGAGALAVKYNNQLYRLADADTATFNALYEGPLQAAFAIHFTNWDVAGSKQDGSETIAVSRGDFYYTNEIALALHTSHNLVAGMAHFITDEAVYKQHNASFASLSTYGKQADGTNTNLGLAMMFPANDYVQTATTDSAAAIPNTVYVALHPSANNRKTIYFFACWQQTDSRFATQKGFENYLAVTADKLASPINIVIEPKN